MAGGGQLQGGRHLIVKHTFGLYDERTRRRDGGFVWMQLAFAHIHPSLFVGAVHAILFFFVFFLALLDSLFDVAS